MLLNYGCSRVFCSKLSPDHKLHPSNLNGLTDEEKLVHVKAEFEHMKQAGFIQLPQTMSAEHWSELSQLPSYRKRNLYLKHISVCEKRREKEIMMKAKKKSQRDERFDPAWNERGNLMEYGLWKNSIFLKNDKSYMTSIKRRKLLNAKLYGQPIIFDLSYNKHMNKHERKDLAIQIGRSMKHNLDHPDPCDLHICNFNPRDECSQILLKYFPRLSRKDSLVSLHEVSCTEVFPASQLVYLSPDADDEVDGELSTVAPGANEKAGPEALRTDAELTSVAPWTAYVVGGLVDLGPGLPLSLARARALGVPARRLPLARSSGDKRLLLNHVFQILLELRDTGSISAALKKQGLSRSVKRTS